MARPKKSRDYEEILVRMRERSRSSLPAQMPAASRKTAFSPVSGAAAVPDAGPLRGADKVSGPPTRRHEIAEAFGMTASLGVGMFLSLLLGVVGGEYLDGLLGTAPVMLIIGVMLGTGASFKVFYDLLIRKWLS